MLASKNFRSMLDGDESSALREQYLTCGCVCALTTNSEEILTAVRQSFTTVAPPDCVAEVNLRFWVDHSVGGSPPWPQPYFRGLNHLVFAAFDSESAVLVDLRRRRAVGRFSKGLVGESSYWRRVIMPALFGIVSPTIRLAALHCACVEREGRGLLLAGNSGSGKSTLSLALAQTGFRFVADDWTYLSRQGERLQAWALPTPLKLLADAWNVFPELTSEEAAPSLNGEMAYEVEPDRVFGVRRAECAEPHWLMFLERCDVPGVALEPMSAVEAAARFEGDLEGLPATVSAHRDFLVKTIRILSQRPCWRLRHGGTASAVARAVTALIDAGGEVGRCEAQPEVSFYPPLKAPDLLRRFTRTALSADLCVLGRAVRLETNSVAILEAACRAFAGYDQPVGGRADFLWRLVGEGSDGPRTEPPPVTVIADEGLFFVNLDRYGFIAVDTDAREAVGFLRGCAEETLFPDVLCSVMAFALDLEIAGSCPAHNGDVPPETTRAPETLS